MSEAVATTAGATATATTSPATTSPQTTSAEPSHWTQGFSDEMKAYVQAKGFKDTAAVLESYRNFEKLQGAPAEHILKLPQNMDSAEGRAIYEKLGMPKDAKDYNVKVSEDFDDATFGDWLRDVAHKNGFTNRQVEGFVQALNEKATSDVKSANDAQEAFLREAHQNLQKEWGAKFEQNKNIADKGAIAFGFGEKEVQALGQALGPDKALMLLHKLGAGTGEATFVAGRPAGYDANTPAQAQMKIQELTKDTGFYKRLMSGDMDAKRMWDKLNREAAAQPQ